MPDVHSLDVGKILPFVRKPGQYTGGELHSVTTLPDAAHLNFCLLFPDLYEIGMSHQGLQILYHILNGDPRFLAHRCYVPDVDMEQAMREAALPLFSLEAKVPVAAYDVLGITLPYELCYTNILTILDLAGLPLRASDRDASHPLVLGGGTCAFNPEPVADFFDALVLGDGEEIILELGALLLGAKEKGLSRSEVLEMLADPAWRDLDTEDDRYLFIRPLMEIPISHVKLITEHYWKMRDLFTDLS